MNTHRIDCEKKSILQRQNSHRGGITSLEDKMEYEADAEALKLHSGNV